MRKLAVNRPRLDGALRAHWATDVIGGYLVGAGILATLVYAYMK